MKKILFALLAAVMLIGCHEKKEDVVLIGGILSLTGNNAIQGNLAKNGILLAIDYINANGGINGKTLDIVIEDSQTTAKGTISAFNKLTQMNKVCAIISTGDVEFMAVNSVLDKKPIPVVATTCVGMIPKDERHPWLFRYCLNEADESDFMMHYVANILKEKTATIVYPNTMFGKTIFDCANNSMHLYNIEMQAGIEYEFESTDQKANAIKVINQSPALLFARGFGSALEVLLKHVAELGYQGKIVGDAALTVPSMIENSGGVLNGAYVVESTFDLNTEDSFMQSYINDYQKAYNSTASYWDAIGFDSCILIAEALRLADKNLSNESIFDALYNMNEVPLVLGKNSFKKDLDINLQMIMRQINNGSVIPIND